MSTKSDYPKGREELRKALATCRKHFRSVGLFSVFVNLLMLTGPLFMLQVYDRVLASRSMPTLVALLVLITGLFIVMGLLEYIRARVLARAGARFQAALDFRVFDAVLRRSVAPEERARPNTAASDLDSLRQLLSGPAPFAIFDMPWTPFFLAIIFIFHWTLGLLAIFGGIVLVTMAFLNDARSRKHQTEAQIAAAQAANLGEALRHEAESVHGLGMRNVGLARWQKLRNDALEAQITAQDRSGAFSSASKTTRFYLQSAMLAAGAALVVQGLVTPGVMIASSILMGRALAPMEQGIAQWGLAQRALRGWKQLSELLEKTPVEPQKTALPRPKGFVEVQNVTVVAPGEQVPTLRQVSFKVSPGEALGVIGPSGSGKTTLAKVLVGIWTPAAGKIRIDGAALDQWPSDVLGRHIGYLPQDVGLFSGSIASNVARLDPEPEDAKIVEAAQRAGAHELLLALPQGYDTDVGSAGSRISGGQRQRVALARALYGDPAVLILDEPNANLDATGEQALVNAIVGAKERGKTVIVMAHRPSAIAACDTLLMLDRGNVVDFGPRDEVLKKRTRNYPQLVAASGAVNTPGAAGMAGGAQGDGQAAPPQAGAPQPGGQQAAPQPPAPQQPGAAKPAAQAPRPAAQPAAQQAAGGQPAAAQGFPPGVPRGALTGAGSAVRNGAKGAPTPKGGNDQKVR